MWGRRGESGVGLVELFLGSTVAMVAVLGTVGGVMTSLKVAIDSKDASRANELAVQVAESFRAGATENFSAAVAEYHGKVVEDGGQRVYVRVILDETRYAPPVDLNGDGDCDDSVLHGGEVQAAYVETKVIWGRNDSKTFLTLVDCRRRGDVAAPH